MAFHTVLGNGEKVILSDGAVRPFQSVDLVPGQDFKDGQLVWFMTRFGPGHDRRVRVWKGVFRYRQSIRLAGLVIPVVEVQHTGGNIKAYPCDTIELFGSFEDCVNRAAAMENYEHREVR